jgi:hypothetical protein
MDSGAQSVARFLEKLQHLRGTLYHELRNHFVRQGARGARYYFVLSGSPFSILTPGKTRQYTGSLSTGMQVSPKAKDKFWLGITLMWDEEKWWIENEIEIETEPDGQVELFHAFPLREALTLEECFQEIDAAADDLRGYVEVIVRELL